MQCFRIIGEDNQKSSTYIDGLATFGDKLTVNSNGAIISGGLNISSAGAAIIGAVTVSGELTVASGMSVLHGVSSGHLVLVDGGVDVVGGIQITNSTGITGGMSLQNGSLQIINGGVQVYQSATVLGGINVSGGMRLRQQISLHDGLRVMNGITVSKIDACVFANDGICDAGSNCAVGTDATDCGYYDSDLTALRIEGDALLHNKMGVNIDAPTLMLDIKSRSYLTQPIQPGVHVSGQYTGHTMSQFLVQIDGTDEGVDTFLYMKDGVTMRTGITITPEDVVLQEGITLQFSSTTGHELGDQWLFGARPVSAIGVYNNTSTSFSVKQDGLVSTLGGANIDNHLILPSANLHLNGAGINLIGGTTINASLQAHSVLTVHNSTDFQVNGGAVITAGDISVGNNGMHVFGAADILSGLDLLHEDMTIHNGSLSAARKAIVNNSITAHSITVECDSINILADGLIIQEDGISIVDNGLSVTSGQMDVLLGGLQANGGATISSEGVVINSGGIRVHSGGASSVGGLFSGGTLHIDSDGLSVHGGTSVTGKMVVSTGGVEITDGFQVHSQGVEVAGGLTTGGRFTVDAGGVRTFGNGVAINTIASDTFVAVQGRSSVQQQPHSHNAQVDLVAFTGTYTGFSDAFFEAQIFHVDSAGVVVDFQWRKCVSNGYTTDLSVSSPVCSSFVVVLMEDGGPHSLIEGVHIHFLAVSGHAQGDTWISHVFTNGSIVIRSARGNVGLFFGQDGSEHLSNGIAVKKVCILLMEQRLLVEMFMLQVVF